MPTPLGVKRKNQQEFFGPHDPALDSVPTPYAHPNPSASAPHNPGCHTKHDEEVD
ncbi:hypothetical protein GCM10010129_83150 [Streptomyces fumigatiscleroticus]|nr:hypothetical protein GCM10010129_83150 [Streptomyces fumigatiscleroticus]